MTFLITFYFLVNSLLGSPSLKSKQIYALIGALRFYYVNLSWFWSIFLRLMIGNSVSLKQPVANEDAYFAKVLWFSLTV